MQALARAASANGNFYLGMKDQLYFRLVEQSILNIQVTSFGLRFSQLSVEQSTLKL